MYVKTMNLKFTEIVLCKTKKKLLPFLVGRLLSKAYQRPIIL